MSDIRCAIEKFSKRIPAGAKILDVGCGLRPYEDLFLDCTYIGIDVPVSGRESLGKKPDYEFDGVNIPLPDSSFDVVICTQVLEHAAEPDFLLKEIERVSKPKALFFLTVPFIWGLHELPYDFRRYTTEGIRHAIIKAGFVIEEQSKLTPGLAALRMLVLSEVNNYKINHMLPSVQWGFWQRFLFVLQDKLFDLLCGVWRRTIKFERIYIDNHIVARKPHLE